MHVPEDQVIGRWGYVFDTDDSWVTGEFALCRDGTLLNRYGGSTTSNDQTTWSFKDWKIWRRSPIPLGVEDAIRMLKADGYSLCDPSPVPLNEHVAGPFNGVPPLAKYI